MAAADRSCATWQPAPRSADKEADKCHEGIESTQEHTDDTFWRLRGKLEKEALEGRLRLPESRGVLGLEPGSFAQLCFSFQTGGPGNAGCSTSYLFLLGRGREEALTGS